MPYAAIRYEIKPGHADEIAELFSHFRRADTPVLTDDDGREVGRLLGTAVFLADTLLIRVIHYEGDLRAVGRHMSQQRGVHILEEKLQPYLAAPRDTSTPEKFQAFFASSVLRCVSQFAAEPVPAGA
jgi:hypothetical protein